MTKILSQKQTYFLLGFLLLLLFLPLPFSNIAKAYGLVNVLTFFPNAIISLFLQLVLLLANGLFFFASHLLTWAIHNPFNLSYTNPSSNPVIQIGWTLLRDITNMLFVLGLAYIGLATAINKSGFNTKKIFGNIIVVALLINFTPVICGIVVDISNILSNFFLGTVNFNSLPEMSNIYQGGVIGALKNLTDVATLMKLTVLIVYGFVGAFVLLVFTFIFLVRPVAIWVLVIFSPLAFFAWIFDETRNWFKMWWEQFLQWSFVVVPAGFFIYLSQQILAHIEDFKATDISGDPALAKLVTQLAPYLVVILFMIIGLMVSLKTSAMGASGIVGFAAAKGKKIKSWGLKKTGQLGLGATKTAAGGAALGLKKYKKGGGVRGAMKEAKRGILTKEGRREGRKASGEILEKLHLKKAGSAALAERRELTQDIEEEKKRLRPLNENERNKTLNRVKDSRFKKDQTVAAALLALKAEKGFIEDEYEDTVKKLQKVLNMNTVFEARPDWIPDFPDQTDSITLNVIKKLGASDIDKIAQDTTDNKIKQKIVDSIKTFNNKLLDEYGNLMRQGKKEAAKKLKDMMEETNNQIAAGSIPKPTKKPQNPQPNNP